MIEEGDKVDPHDELHLSVLKWMRATRSASLYYVDKEGKRRKIALRAGKGRWEIAARFVMRMIDEIERLEAEDVRGAMVDTWRVPEASDTEAEAQAVVAKERAREEDATPREMRAVAFLNRMIEEARIQAVSEHMKAQRELFGFLIDQQKQQTMRLEKLENSMTGMVNTVFNAYKTRAQIEGFIAGGGLRQQQQQETDPNERLALALVAQKLGLNLHALPKGFLGMAEEPSAPPVPGNSPDDPF